MYISNREKEGLERYERYEEDICITKVKFQHLTGFQFSAEGDMKSTN